MNHSKIEPAASRELRSDSFDDAILPMFCPDVSKRFRAVELPFDASLGN